MYEYIKSLDDLIKLGIEEVVKFHNYYIEEFEAGRISKSEFRQQHNIHFSHVIQHIKSTKQYKLQGSLFVAGTPRQFKKKEKPVLTDKEINFLKELARKGLTDYRSPELQESVSGGKIKQTVYFTDEINEQFNEYCKNHKRFNKSQHLLMALAEYMDKYK